MNDETWVMRPSLTLTLQLTLLYLQNRWKEVLILALSMMQEEAAAFVLQIS